MHLCTVYIYTHIKDFIRNIYIFKMNIEDVTQQPTIFFILTHNTVLKFLEQKY